MSEIQTWAGLSAVTGIPPRALHMRWKRGTLPLAVTWSEGRRAFDPAEVKHWIDAGMPRRQH